MLAQTTASAVRPTQEHPPSDATPAAEPSGYWSGPINNPVPTTIAGGKVIRAPALAALVKRGDAVIIDVSNAPRRPDGLAPSAPWLPLPHQAVPDAIWIPGAGEGELSGPVDQYYRDRLAAATRNDRRRTIVVYCHERCWLSWNGAKRAISYGYRHVYWFPDGIEGWRAAGFKTVVVTPEPVPVP
jgi:PQQ-dependent catabolism-associated CXXCW motif protein